jgi:MFS transporter, ACS family, glucarate transporter
MNFLPTRYWLVFGTFCLSVLLYVDRACIATAKDDVVRELELTDIQWAWVLASFAFGYALFQTPSGMMADRLGSRGVLTAVVAVWSIFTGMSAIAWNFTSLMVIRFLFGAGEAGAFPGLAKVVYAWIPVRERGLVKGINFSGSRIGAAIAMPMIAALIAALGWKLTFLILMVVGFAWSTFWWWWFRNDPSAHQRISAEERNYILAGRQQALEPSSASQNPLSVALEARKGISLKKLLCSNNMWLMMGQYFASNFTFFFSLTWLYPYVKSTYQLNAIGAGYAAMTPLLAGALGNIVSGCLVDFLYRCGWHDWSRKLPAILGFFLAALGMVMSLDQASVFGAVFWLSIAIFGADMTLSPSWSFCIDIGGKNAGIVSGTMNMAGNLGSAITALAFAYMPKSSQGNEAFFYTAAALSGIAIFCWIFADARKRLVPT